MTKYKLSNREGLTYKIKLVIPKNVDVSTYITSQVLHTGALTRLVELELQF